MGVRLLVVEQASDCGPALFGRWLQEAGAQLDIARVYSGEALPTLNGYDGWLILGGPMAAWEDDVAAWLPSLREQLRTAVRNQVPTLGICLGAQLLAAACGGRVQRGPVGAELGAPTISLTAAAADDPLFRDVAPLAPAAQWHNDVVVELPPGAVLLGSTSTYRVQAFRVGPCAWGVQFHPEATPEVVVAWARSDGSVYEAAGHDVDARLHEIEAHRDDLLQSWKPMATAFATRIAQGSQAK